MESKIFNCLIFIENIYILTSLKVIGSNSARLKSRSKSCWVELVIRFEWKFIKFIILDFQTDIAWPTASGHLCQRFVRQGQRNVRQIGRSPGIRTRMVQGLDRIKLSEFCLRSISSGSICWSATYSGLSTALVCVCACMPVCVYLSVCACLCVCVWERVRVRERVREKIDWCIWRRKYRG